MSHTHHRAHLPLCWPGYQRGTKILLFVFKSVQWTGTESHFGTALPRFHLSSLRIQI